MYEDLDNASVYDIAKERCITFGSNFLPDIVTKTQGVYFWTASDSKVMDFTSGQMSTLLGHGHPEVVETVRKHAAELDHLYSGMVSMSSL
jgi:4-aminobutyrate aminotransferase-like enzyme